MPLYKGLFIGGKTKNLVENDSKGKKKRTLYPTYRAWSDCQGLKPMARPSFSFHLKRDLIAANFKVDIKRKSGGQFVFGVHFKGV